MPRADDLASRSPRTGRRGGVQNPACAPLRVKNPRVAESFSRIRPDPRRVRANAASKRVDTVSRTCSGACTHHLASRTLANERLLRYVKGRRCFTTRALVGASWSWCEFSPIIGRTPPIKLTHYGGLFTCVQPTELSQNLVRPNAHSCSFDESRTVHRHHLSTLAAAFRLIEEARADFSIALFRPRSRPHRRQKPKMPTLRYVSDILRLACAVPRARATSQRVPPGRGSQFPLAFGPIPRDSLR